MTDRKLDPEIVNFKTFINKHPKLIKEIRKNGKSWQEVYEQWTLLGEDDIHWNQYKESEEGSQEEESSFKLDLKPDLINQIVKYTESIDINKLQEQVQQLSNTISTVQEVVSQYQTNKRPNDSNRPFSWFHD